MPPANAEKEAVSLASLVKGRRTAASGGGIANPRQHQFKATDSTNGNPSVTAVTPFDKGVKMATADTTRDKNRHINEALPCPMFVKFVSCITSQIRIK